jgi:hypothetical protein
MDDSKPAIPPGKLRSQSASVRTSADIDPPRAALAKADQRAAVERQSRCGEIEPCRTDLSNGPSVAVYYRNEDEVREGFLIAISIMGVAPAEQLPEPAKPPVRRPKP